MLNVECFPRSAARRGDPRTSGPSPTSFRRRRVLPCRMQEVIIIGGGIAGLGAATVLLRAGRAVTILEAKSRLGGRIHTVHDGPLPIELGAEFLHGRSPPLLRAIEAAGLS